MHWNHPETISRRPHPGVWKNSTKPVPGTRKVGDHCVKTQQQQEENPVGCGNSVKLKSVPTYRISLGRSHILLFTNLFLI